MSKGTSKSKSPSNREAPNPKLQNKGVAAVNYWNSAMNGSGVELHEMVDGKEGRPHPFDLEERTSKFGEAIIRLSKKIPRDPTNNRLIDQVVGAGTSVGANYCEANEAVSKKDFRNTVGRCAKEAKETRFFLRMIAASEPQLAEEARHLYREATELLLIFSSMRRK